MSGDPYNGPSKGQSKRQIESERRNAGYVAPVAPRRPVNDGRALYGQFGSLLKSMPPGQGRYTPEEAAVQAQRFQDGLAALAQANEDALT